MVNIEDNHPEVTRPALVTTGRVGGSRPERQLPAHSIDSECEICHDQSNCLGTKSTGQRRFQPLRFVFGLVLTTLGVSLILFVAIRVFDIHHFAGRFAMTLVALTVLLGVIMLGGGFGVMVTASAGFDDGEFEQLLHRGNISVAGMDSTADASDPLRRDTGRRVA